MMFNTAVTALLVGFAAAFAPTPNAIKSLNTVRRREAILRLNGNSSSFCGGVPHINSHDILVVRFVLGLVYG